MQFWVAVALGAAVVIWGGSFLATQILVREVPPLLAAVLRFSLASGVLLAVARIQLGKWVIPSRQEWRGLFIYGLLAVTLCFTFENTALQLTSSGNASVIIGLIPVGTLLAARWGLQETLTSRQVWGSLVATVGTFWLVSEGNTLGLSNLKGDLLMGGAMLCSVASGLAAKRNSATLTPLLNTGYSFGIGATLMIPLAIGEWFWKPEAFSLSLNGWLALLYLSVLASAVAYTAYFYALSQATLSAATLPTYLTPVVTLIMAAGLTGEPLSWNRGLAAGVVVLGLVLTSPSWDKEPMGTA